jgi:hypothetical protein
MSFIDSLERGIGSVLKTMLENITGPMACVQLQDAKSPQDEYIDADKICTNLMDRLELEPLTDAVKQEVDRYCRMSCQPEMRPVPILASFPPPMASLPPTTEVATAALPPPQQEAAVAESTPPVVRPGFDDPAEVLAEINRIMSGYHGNPYDDPSNFRDDPYATMDGTDDKAAASALPNHAATPKPMSNDGKEDPCPASPYSTSDENVPVEPFLAPGVELETNASPEPMFVVRSSEMPRPIEAIPAGAAAAAGGDTGFVLKPFFTDRQRNLCGCFERRSTDTKLDVQMCFADADRYSSSQPR